MKNLTKTVFVLLILCWVSFSQANFGFVDSLCGQFRNGVCIRCSWRSFKNSKGLCEQVSQLCNDFDQSSGACKSCYPGFTLRSGACLQKQKLDSFVPTPIPKKFSLPELDYNYAALEPVISAKIMELHHSKHHNAFVNNLNAALQQFEQAKKNFDFNRMASLLQTIRFNLGGHINHSIFWKNLAPIGLGGGEFPDKDSALTQQVLKQFGSFEKLIEEMTKKTVAIQGSGWGWLGYDQAGQALRIMQTANQDMLAPTGLIPLLGIDVWEHAYYLDYFNVRATYMKQIWKIVNWKDVEKRFLSAIKK